MTLEERVDAPLEIVPGVWRIGGGSWNGRTCALSAEADGNVYLIELPRGHAVVDCGTRAGLPAIRQNLSRLGLDVGQVDHLLLTHAHWDHAEAAATWQALAPHVVTHLNSVGHAYLRQGDYRITGHQILEPPYVFDSFAVDHPVDDGDRFEIGVAPVTARHLPGHTPDSTLYVFELAGSQVGICGDVAFDRPVLGQLCTLWMSNLDDYAASLRKLERVPLDVLLPGHGDPVVGSASVAAAIGAALDVAEALAADRRVRENLGV
jgi:glyoxylase-like metal-dependent hydrolase (beta-lactamase superfamily II)